MAQILFFLPWFWRNSVLASVGEEFVFSEGEKAGGGEKKTAKIGCGGGSCVASFCFFA